mgnify:CR=1 FL=1
MTVEEMLVKELEIEVNKTAEGKRNFILSDEELSAIVGYIRVLEEEVEEFGKTNSTGIYCAE